MLSLLVGIGGAHPQRSCPQGRGWAWDSPSLLPRPPGLLLGCGDAELDPGVLLLLVVAWGVARRAFGGLQPSRGPVPSPRSRCPQLQRGWGRWALPLGCPRCSRRASPATPGRSCLELHLGVSSGLSQFSGQPHGGRGCHFRARAVAPARGSAGGTFGPIPTKGTQTSGK